MKVRVGLDRLRTTPVCFFFELSLSGTDEDAKLSGAIGDTPLEDASTLALRSAAAADEDDEDDEQETEADDDDEEARNEEEGAALSRMHSFL